MNKPPAKKDALASHTNGAIVEIPDYLRKQPGEKLAGVSNMDPQEDMTIARLNIANSDTTTPQMNEDSPNYIEGLKGGDFFNTASREIYGPKVKIIPLDFFKDRVMWPPKGSKSNTILCKSRDAITGEGTPGGACRTCPMAEFGKDPGKSKRPPCTLVFNYPALIVRTGKPIGMDSLVLLGFKSTSMDEGKAFNKLTQLINVDIYGCMYELSSIKVSDDSGIYFKHSMVQPAGFISQEALKTVRLLAEAVSRMEMPEPGSEETVAV